ncbi:maltotransferase domain-containing protein [Acidisphaera sp. S103]|uniref:maltotransferase domain-containing protein n=1 Tax=Acidisphaera sp. S103 TaxID=1747223 RepID=UPI001C2092C8|nr:maltotransferase domain-containing protein [Acidisphaera sp. S103]
MGFSHVCLAPPFEPGAGGDIFIHAGFDRLHPALRFDGPAEQGIERAVGMAADAGLRLMLDIAPGQIAVDSPLRQRHPDWFGPAGGGQIADPRRKPHRVDVAVPRFGQTVVADAVSDWWIERLTRLTRSGVAGFRCLTLDLVPPAFWRRVIAPFPDALFLAWTPEIINPRDFAGTGFDLACSVAGHMSLLLDEQAALRDVAPVLVSPEPSFLDRLTRHLPADADIADAYRLALGVAAAAGAGLFVPMGFEYATSRPFDAARASPADMEAVQRDKPADLSDDVAAAIRLTAALSPAIGPRPLTSPAGKVVAWLRADTLILINPDIVRPASVGFSLAPLPGTGLSATGDPGTPLRPGEIRILQCRQAQDIPGGELALARPWAEATRIAVESVEPEGDFPAKTVVGRDFVVSADVFGDGHDVLAADLLWQPADARDWQRIPMRKLDNDRWEVRFRPDRVGLYRFAVEGWWDQWGTFTHDLRAKVAAGQDVTLEIQEGRQLVTAALPRASVGTTADELLSDELRAAMNRADQRPFAARSAVHTVRVDRPAAEFASWYELFPRSATHDPAVHGTFRSVIERLPDIRGMGFDVLYFPPIHPIGRINRKGRNNSLRAAPGEVGSPYAIGGTEGGHDAVHPELGTLDDFRALVHAARENDLEIAVDFAIQCAPDHPWVTQHRDWFRWRPDGSMRYAENPPKKYEDIVNPDFYGEASFPAVWTALRDVVQFWVDQGVRIFRVDNPHTKPLPFWQWMIADIQARHPDVLFLAEAFTRPKPMYRLAKMGFSQSYTYFTWRNTKAEIVAYLTELTTPPVVDFFRPNFFVNTPDINPVYLQTAGRAGFLIRMVLAATLSGLWGVYSGFELCEAAPLPGREEYLDSEKYQIRVRDYAAPGNIVAEIAALNRIRRQHPALQSHRGLAFYNAFNDQIVLYGKRDPLDGSMVLVAVSLDPHIVQEAAIEIPLWEFGLADHATISVTDLMMGENFMWHGKNQHIRLDPAESPFRIWRLEVR